MIFMLLFVLAIFGFAQCVPAPGHGALAGYCNTGDHCDIDECCVSFIQPRRKRVVVDHLEPNLMQFTDGHCQKLGTNGSYCFVNELSTGQDGLYYDCPCAAGYECIPTGEIGLDKGPPGTCEPVTKTATLTLNQPCTSGADCALTECCVSDVRPIGKRQAEGHCEAMGTDDSSCLVRYNGEERPNGTAFACPCMHGLTCHGNGMHDIPLGELGTCGV